ncbi:hypothetical protein Q9233_008206 [Columba guinea]|nr:hypothetical protein Q9233_008206 [Columba guinea]
MKHMDDCVGRRSELLSVSSATSPAPALPRHSGLPVSPEQAKLCPGGHHPAVPSCHCTETPGAAAGPPCPPFPGGCSLRCTRAAACVLKDGVPGRALRGLVTVGALARGWCWPTAPWGPFLPPCDVPMLSPGIRIGLGSSLLVPLVVPSGPQALLRPPAPRRVPLPSPAPQPLQQFTSPKCSKVWVLLWR